MIMNAHIKGFYTQCSQLYIDYMAVSYVCKYVGFAYVILYLIQVSVAPHLSISEDSGYDPSLTVVLPLLCGWASLKACHLSRTGYTNTYTNIRFYGRLMSG